MTQSKARRGKVIDASEVAVRKRARAFIRRNELDIRLHALAILFAVPSAPRKRKAMKGRTS